MIDPASQPERPDADGGAPLRLVGGEQAAGPQSEAAGEGASNEPTLRQAAPAGMLGVAWTAFPAILGFTLLARLGDAAVWLQSHGQWGLAVYVSLFIFAAGLGLLPTYAQSVLGGWVFGLGVGLPAALAGFTGAALIGYAIARTVARDHVNALVDRKPNARAVREALIGHGFWRTLGTVALLRMPPNSPFALTNLAMASTRVPLAPFLIGTAIGMTPRTLAAVALAAAARSTGAKDIQTFAAERGTWLVVAGIVSLVIVLMIFGAIGSRAVKRLTPPATPPAVGGPSGR